MKQNKSILLLSGILAVLFLIGNRCNLPETVTTTDADITLPPDTGAIYKFAKYYYVLVPGDTAMFYGTRECTLSTNGVIDTCISDSAYLRIITQKGTSLTVDDTVRFVYPQLYQHSSTFSELGTYTVTRYMEKSDSATLQVAFKENGKLTICPKTRRIIMPRTLIVGPYAQFVTDSTDIPINNTWPTSPLIVTPVSGEQERIRFDGYSVARRVIAPPKSGEPPYQICGVQYTNGIFVDAYFSLDGEMLEDGDIIRVIGCVTIVRSYFVERGIIDQETLSSIVKLYPDGSVKRIRERIYVSRGPEGAKQFSENTDTLSCE